MVRSSTKRSEREVSGRADCRNRLPRYSRVMIKDILAGYAAEGPDIISRFEAIAPEELYRQVERVMPDRPQSVLDIGAGTGRDAAWFVAKGARVVAVEPVSELRAAGQALHKSPNIEWLDDALPALSKTVARSERFELILLSGVWQHLDAPMRKTAMQNLRKLIKAGGTLIISVRDGLGTPSRPVFPADVDDTIEMANKENFQLQLHQSADSVQKTNRNAGVKWTWLAFAGAP